MQQDGLNYVFIHRSFQEYFAAYALTTIFRDKCQIFSKVIKGRRSDGFLRLAYELDRDFILREFVFPEYAQVLKDIVSRRNSRRPFCSIVATGMQYQIELEVDSETSKSKGSAQLHVHSLGMEDKGNVLQFLDMLKRLRDVFSDQMPSFEFEDNFVRMVFDEIQSVLDRLKISTDRLSISAGQRGGISLSFSDADFSISLYSIEGEDEELETLVREIDAALRSQRDVIVKMAEKLRAQIETAQIWCENCILESEDRERSLSEILKLN